MILFLIIFLKVKMIKLISQLKGQLLDYQITLW